MGYLPRRTAHRDWKNPRESLLPVAVSKTGREEPSKPFDMEHGVTEFGVCPGGFWSSFGLLFPYYAPIPFGMVMYSLCHFMLEICYLLFFTL